MPDFIKDGVGQGYLAKVNKKNEVAVRTSSVQQHTRSALDGNYYELTTGIITLGDSGEHGIIYLKNNETTTMLIDRVFMDVWPSTGGDSTFGGILKYYKNPVVTGGDSITPTNTNFARAEVKGIDLRNVATITGSVWWTSRIAAGSALALEEGRFCLPPGYSFGISITPPDNNTSMKVSCNVAFYRFDMTLI
jgi:hypothetical protein